MVVELLTPVWGYLLGKAADTGWTMAMDQVQTTLQRTDIERAIKAGLEAVRLWEQSLEVQDLLFKRCDDRQKRQFLEQVFANAGVVEQLKRPLIGKGEPDVDLVQAYFERVAKDVGVELTNESLPPWLRLFTDTYIEKTALFTQYQITRQHYLKQIAKWYEDVKFLGISVAGQEDAESEKLLKIFVMPDVKQRGDKRQRGFDEDLQANVRHLESRQADLLAEQRQLISILKQEGKPFSAEAILRKSRSQRCVLLGAPGSGKTTLMSYFAVALATGQMPTTAGISNDHLPVLVRILDWVGSSHTGLLDYMRWYTTDKLAVKDLPQGFFEHWLEAGRTLLLLDGLDEVASGSRRDEIASQIKCFLQHEKHRKNPAIITSRPAGYRQAYFRTEEFPHYDLQPFDQPKIYKFIQNWYENRFRNPEESRLRKKALKTALLTPGRIQILAKNPLLLTIIILIQSSNPQEFYLPRKRHQLYNQAVETLLNSWDIYKEPDYKWPFEYLKRDAVRRMMEQLAYWIHCYGSAGDAEGGTLIDKDELINQLSKFISEEADIKRYQAKDEAQRFLKHIRERTGLLHEQGQDCYAFVHKTFQEYLCAQEIKYRADEEYDEKLILAPIHEHLHESHWEEVLVLLIAQQPQKRVAHIIRQILDYPTPYEQWLHRNLFFAATCLAEDIELVDTQLIDQILSLLVEFVIPELPQIASRLKQQAEKTLRNLGGTTFQDLALQKLNAQEDKIDTVELQGFRFALGQEALAKNILITLLSNGDERIRSNVMNALSKLGGATPEVVQVLLPYLNHTNAHIRSDALQALGQFDSNFHNLTQTLFNKLFDEFDEVRFGAARVIEQLDEIVPEVVQALCPYLTHPNKLVRIFAAEALSRFGHTDPKVLQALLSCLEEDEGIICAAAASALGLFGDANPEVIQALLLCLNKKDDIVRCQAAEALGQLGDTHPTVLMDLLSLLKNDHLLVRIKATQALGQLGQATPEVTQALLLLLKDDDVVNVQLEAALTLGKLGHSSPEATQALLLLLKDRSSVISSQAALGLGQFGEATSDVAQALLLLLKDDIGVVCSSAAQALGLLGKRMDAVTQQLVQWIGQNQQSDYVHHGIDALWDIMTDQS